MDYFYPQTDPGLVGEITVSIAKENDFFIFNFKKGKNIVMFMKILSVFVITSHIAMLMISLQKTFECIKCFMGC